MKKISFYLFLFSFFALSGCIKNDLKTWNGTFAEIDATSWNANGAGVTYPFMTRIPVGGRAAITVDSTLRRLNGTIRVRINLVGAHSSKDETVGYSIFNSPITSVAFPATATGQTPVQAAATLAVTDAVAGTHFTALSGTVTIPKDSSFGYINIQILNPGATAGQAKFLGIQINNSGSLQASVNYSQVGLVIDQR